MSKKFIAKRMEHHSQVKQHQRKFQWEESGAIGFDGANNSGKDHRHGQQQLTVSAVSGKKRDGQGQGGPVLRRETPKVDNKRPSRDVRNVAQASK
jgi:hypothetical protein